VVPSWAPLGAARFKELVQTGFLDGCKFFRAIKNFMVQFGIASTPEVHRRYQGQGGAITDDPVKQKNSRGTVSFAMSGKNSRSSQLFINLVDNSFLDGQGFAPFARVISGIEFVDALYMGYGEGGRGDGTDGKGPSQNKIVNQGNSYLDKTFPKLSFIVSTKILAKK